MPSANLRMQSPPGFHRESVRHVAEALEGAGFVVSRFLVAQGSHALRASHSIGCSIEVWVRARRDVNGIVSVSRAQLDPAPHRLVAFVWLRPGAPVATYLIPSMRWLDRAGALLGSSEGPSGCGAGNWTLTPHAARLEPYRFEVTVAKLLHGT